MPKRLRNIPHGLIEDYIPNTSEGNRTLAQLAKSSKNERVSGEYARRMPSRVARANAKRQLKRNQITRNIEQKALQMFRVAYPNANGNGNIANSNGRVVISWNTNKPQWINQVKIMIGNPQLNVNRMTNRENMNEILRLVRAIDPPALAAARRAERLAGVSPEELRDYFYRGFEMSGSSIPSSFRTRNSLAFLTPANKSYLINGWGPRPNLRARMSRYTNAELNGLFNALRLRERYLNLNW